MLLLRFSRLFNHLDSRQGCVLANFSTEAKQTQMKDNRERAVWAFHIIKTITYAETSNEKDINKPSLRDELLDLQISSPHFTSTQENRNSSLAIFKTGVSLNQNVFNRTRILDGKEKKSSKNSQEFIFCPNLLVTRPMFSLLWEKNRSILTFGGYGISKTISIVLFHYLSSIINKYIYAAFLDEKQRIKLQELRKYKLIQDVPKFFYWNIDTDFDQIQMQNVKKCLLYQATELSKEEQNQLQNLLSYNADIWEFHKYVRLLRSFYSLKRIQTKVVIDQLSIVATLMKRSNEFYIPYKRKKNQNLKKLNALFKTKEEQELQMNKTKGGQELQMNKTLLMEIQRMQQQISQKRAQWLKNEQAYMIPAQKISSIIHALPILGRNIVYNTSNNIQGYYLKVNKESDINILTLRLEDHNILEKVKIKFHQCLNEEWARNDFYQYFWFQIEKRLSSKGFSQTLPNLKTKFYQRVKVRELQKKLPKYVRFLNIRQIFQKDPELLNFSPNSSDQTVLNKFDQSIKQLPVYARKKCVDKILQFIKKGQSEDIKKKRKFIQRLLFLALNSQKSSRNNAMQFTNQQLETKNLRGAVSKYLMSSHYNHELLPVEYTQTQIYLSQYKIYFQWTPTEFLEIGWQSMLKYLREIHEIEATDEEIKIYLFQFSQLANNPEDIFKHHLIKVLESPEVLITYNDSLIPKPCK